MKAPTLDTVADAQSLTAYDFSRPMTLPREHARVVEMAFDTFSRQWTTQMVGSLRTAVRVTFNTLEMVSYDDYVNRLPATTTLILCSIEGGRRTAVFEQPVDATLRYLERMLGGTGIGQTVPARELTEIERQLLNHLMKPVYKDLDYCFSQILALGTTMRSVQYTPQVMQVVAAATPVLVARFTVEVNEEAVDATIMMPAEDIVAALRENQDVDHRSPEEIAEARVHQIKLDRAVQEVPVALHVRMHPVPVHPLQILKLKVGDVLPLNQPASRPLEVVVGDRVLAHAAPGASGSRLAGLIVDVKEKP